MANIRVLIVDDSVIFRSTIRMALEGVEGIEVAGVAAHGRIALEKLRQLPVDVVTLDLEMPEMDGLATLAEIRKLPNPPRVIVFSSITRRGAEATLEALNRGASDFVTKPDGSTPDSGGPAETIRALLVDKVKDLGSREPSRSAVPAPRPVAVTTPAVPAWARRDFAGMRPGLIVIGASTGGPSALERILSEMGRELRGKTHCPVVIVQHMPPFFTGMLAERLAKLSGLQIREAKQMEPLAPGVVYIAPGDYHLRLVDTGDGVIKLQLDQGAQRHSVRPCVDYLFESAARLFGARVAGFVLTGMGCDGKEGAEALKRGGAPVMIQSKESCVVFGMPGAVHAAGAYDRIGGIDELRGTLAGLLASGMTDREAA